jgi:replicative DNA helicase
MIGIANSLLYIAMINPESLTDIDLQWGSMPHQWQEDVWQQINILYNAKSKLDVVMVAEALELAKKPTPYASGQGSWLSFLGTMMKDCVGSPNNAKHYADALALWQRKTRCAQIGEELVSKAVSGKDGSDEAIKDLMAMSASMKTLDGPLAESIHEAVDALDARSQKRGEIHGVPFGLAGLDNLLSGMDKTHLIILAARPAMGKTAMALNVCANNFKRPIGFISTEQPRREMINRLVSISGGVNSHRMRTGQLEDSDWANASAAYSNISQWPLYMNDRAAPTIFDIVRQARKWKHRYGIELLIVDYIQRVKVPGKDRHEEVGEVAMTLKNLGRELEIPVLALSQINRGVESRPNKRPVLSDLRESGDIEQEADVIITVYRDEVYHAEDNNKGKVELAAIKNRHGPIGITHAHYEGMYLRFNNPSTLDDFQRDLPIPEEPRAYRTNG